jgi:hypothetical protein
MWKGVPEEERFRFKQLAADMQSQFKLKNPSYGYRKRSKPTDASFIFGGIKC